MSICSKGTEYYILCEERVKIVQYSVYNIYYSEE